MCVHLQQRVHFFKLTSVLLTSSNVTISNDSKADKALMGATEKED